MRFISVVIAGLTVFPAAAFAQSETSASAVVTTSGGYSTNPFAGTGGGAGYAELRVQPSVQLRTERDTITLIGDAQLQQYFRRYSTRDNYSGRVALVRRQSERLTLNGSMSYLNAISGSAFNGAVIDDRQVDPGTLPQLPVVANDLGLFGFGNRRETVDAQVGATLLWSTVDQINIYGSAVKTSNSQPGLAVDYRGFGGGLGYSRRLNESLRIGLTGSVNKTDYVRNAETTVYSGEATFDARLNERWTLAGSVGLSRLDSTSQSVQLGGSSSQTTVSGHANLCRLTPTGQLCLGVNRAILPSSFGGARVQSSIDLNYSARLSERDTITAHSGYSKVDGGTDIGIGAFGNFRYFTNNVGYTRQLAERLGLSATAFYRKVDGGAVNRNDDVGGTIGLAYTFGKLR